MFCCLLIALAGKLQAFPYDNSLGDLPTNETLNGIDSQTAGTVATYNIPTTNWPSNLSLSNVRGGDGGYARATATIGASQAGNGGGGALATANFSIDLDAAGALRPGGQLRFIVGNMGQDKTRGNAAGSGGGGGTAVLYRAPTESATWEILVVAGGGGGGAASTVTNDTFSQNGADASTSVNGTNGKGQGGASGRSGGNNGGAGVTVNGGDGGGGGSYRENSKSPNGTFWDASGRSGGDQGKQGGKSAGFGSWGGFGFGSGGGGFVNSSGGQSYIARGGGGGGYSGGGAGGNHDEGDGAGGGGGSYVNPIAISGFVFSRNSQRLNGAIAYTTFGVIGGSSIPGATITLSGSNPVNLAYGGSYSEPGFSGVDHYGNPVTVTTSGNSSVSNGVPGTHQIAYSATDQFGKVSTATRTVIIGNPSLPTFSIAGNVSRDENSGTYSQANFATNFNANDPGETLDSYTVTNDNNALFSAQPSINNQGVLTFTPSSNAFGSALVTVIATDTNPYPQYADSSPLTFTITINEISNSPTFSLSGNITRNKDAPSQALSNFATNFNANDAGQSFDRYELTNDNTGLFSVQPAINSAGALTFTPDGEAFGSATVTVTGYDDGPFNNSSTQTFVLTINQLDPVASFTSNKTVILPNETVAFTDSSSNATAWSWDFDEDGEIDSTEQNPTHTYTASGTFSVSLTVTNSVGSDTITRTDLIRVTSYGFVNAGFDSTDLANGSGTAESLGRGWYAKNGDDGIVASPDWSAGLTTGTPGVLTQIKNSGTATRMGQFFLNNLTGSNWALSVDLGGAAGFDQVRMYAGTLAANPSGPVLRTDNGPPSGGLVDGNGWTSLLYQPEVNQSGTVVLNLDDHDLGQFNVIAIQFRSRNHSGTTFDNFALVPQVAPATGSDSFDGTPDETISGEVLANDSAAALNSPLTISAVNSEESAVGNEITLSSGALLKLSADGIFSYDPNGAFDALASGESTTDSFTYTVGTGSLTSTASVTIAIEVPDPVVAFRDEYGLASDGSDDAADWSNNGVANILYHVFGLGDPNEVNIDRSHLPKQTNDGNTITVRYRHRFPVEGFSIAHLTSTDLRNWESTSTLIGTAEAPIDITSSIDEPGYLTTSITFPAAATSRFFNFAITTSGVAGE